MPIPTYRGNAIPVLSVRPDESTPPKWRSRYATTITESLNGSEERQSRQPRALYGLNFTTSALSAAETAYLRALLEKPDALPVACPLWPLKVKLMAAAAAAATSLSLDETADCLLTLYADANWPLDTPVFSEFAILWQAFDHWEIVELDSVTANGATLLAGLVNDYTTSAYLIPIAYGHAPRGNIDQLSDEHGQWECDFQETFHRLHDQSDPEDAAFTFDPTACAVVDITDGGGNTFDCYEDGDYSDGNFPLAGTGFSAYFAGDSPFGIPVGDTFESYADGAYAGGTPGNGVTGFDLIYVGDGP